MTSNALPTNANFQQVLDELALLGDEATRNPIDDPLYQQFIQRFPAEHLPQLSLAEYCVGKGDGESFCWWLERGLQPVMGRYMPGTSRGHILYFQKDGTVYRHRFLKALSDADALRYTLRVQACIAQADLSLGPRWIDSDAQLYQRAGVEPRVTVGDGRKLRLLACYHPNETLPISSSPHLGHFLQVLGCPAADLPPKRQPVARMLLLRRYFELARQSVPGLTPFGFMKALYSERLGLAPVKEDDAADDADLDDGKDAKKRSKGPAGTSSPARQPLNQILYGPPGTGKTYATIDAALAILDPAFLAANLSDRQALKARFDAFARERRVRFVTFHQSFSYEDFVEGIRAITDEGTGQLRYRIDDGVFKTACIDAIDTQPARPSGPVTMEGRRVWKLSLGGENAASSAVYETCLQDNCIMLNYGAGVDLSGCQSKDDLLDRYAAAGLTVANPAKDYAVTCMLPFVHEVQVGDLVIVDAGIYKFRAIAEITGPYQYLNTPVAGGYSHSRNVRWLRQFSTPISADDHLGRGQFARRPFYKLHPPKPESDALEFDVRKLQSLLSHEAEPLRPTVLIIDEINRGNISRIFGELITLIESSKRAGATEALEVLLPYSKKPFSVPANVYLVGTMNTADRSLAAMDVALRRRFVFKEMPPRPGLLQGVEVGAVRVDELLRVMNQRIEALLDRDHCLGHAYFMPLRDEPSAAKLAEIFRVQVLPLLQEYFFDDLQRIQWVLNDHRKRNAAYRFVTASDVNSADLFGAEVNIARSPQLWRINEDAFLCEQSYLGVINHEDASA